MENLKKSTASSRVESILILTKCKQSEVCARAKISPTYLSDCKSGKIANISLEKAVQLHTAFPQLPIDWLRGLTDELPAEATERPTQSAIASGDHAVGFQFNTEEGLVPSLLRQLEAKDKIIHMQMQQILSLTALVGAQK